MTQKTVGPIKKQVTWSQRKHRSARATRFGGANAPTPIRLTSVDAMRSAVHYFAYAVEVDQPWEPDGTIQTLPSEEAKADVASHLGDLLKAFTGGG